MGTQWIVFGVVWGALVFAGFMIAGAGSYHLRKQMNSETEPFDMRRSHLIHVDNANQLFIITILLAGILAVLVATLLVR